MAWRAVCHRADELSKVMLIIRPEQMDAFRDVAEQALVSEIIAYLREKHAGAIVRLSDGVYTIKQMADERLREMVIHAVARARAYGMTWKSSLQAFVVTMVVAAPNFDEHPIIQRILKDEKIAADRRLDALWERTSEQNWEAVEHNYDVSAWGLNDKEEGQ
jgi:hypothetical protein